MVLYMKLIFKAQIIRTNMSHMEAASYPHTHTKIVSIKRIAGNNKDRKTFLITIHFWKTFREEQL